MNINFNQINNQNEVIISYSSTALYEAMLYKKNIIIYIKNKIITLKLIIISI
jgi:hypothetical protein